MDYGLREYASRRELVNELHARPYNEVQVPIRGSHIALFSGEDARDADWGHLLALCEAYDAPQPPRDATFFTITLGPVWLRWERHTEFSTYTFYRDGELKENPFADPVIGLLPREWLSGLPGSVLAAAHFAVEPEGTPGRGPQEIPYLFGGHTIIGARIGGGAGVAWTDMRLHEDGFARILLRDVAFTPRQSGRYLQRMLEIHTYRLLAITALPLARAAGPRLTQAEHRLEQVAAEIGGQGATAADEERRERDLLAELSTVAADVEKVAVTTSYRFDAAQAYYALVQQRLAELREERIQGLQPFSEFLSRRLDPAIRTCEAVAHRQDILAGRAGRMISLLRARVAMAMEAQNQKLLDSMDRRARLQLRLQETVEGLSVVVLSYYLVSLIAYGLKGVKALGLPVNPPVLTALAVPVVGLGLWFGLKRAKRFLHHEEP